MEYVIRPLIPTNIDDVYQYFEVLKRSTETEKKTGALMRIREEIENVNTIKNSCNNISDKVF